MTDRDTLRCAPLPPLHDPVWALGRKRVEAIHTFASECVRNRGLYAALERIYGPMLAGDMFPEDDDPEAPPR